MSNNYYENYKEQVIHIIGGVNEYVGEFAGVASKNGDDWIRIKNPCRVLYKGMEIGLASLFNAGSMYKQYVDIRIPKDSIIEILTLLKDGNLMKNYIKESTREKSSLIIPEGGIKLN